MNPLELLKQKVDGLRQRFFFTPRHLGTFMTRPDPAFPAHPVAVFQMQFDTTSPHTYIEVSLLTLEHMTAGISLLYPDEQHKIPPQELKDGLDKLRGAILSVQTGLIPNFNFLGQSPISLYPVGSEPVPKPIRRYDPPQDDNYGISIGL